MPADVVGGVAKELPRTALQFRFGECTFAEKKSDAADDDKSVPFTMTARTKDPINHWYWGRVVHDMDGMELRKSTLPVDYCHSSYDVLGFANKFDVKSGDLVVSGALTPFPDKKDDRAAEIIYKQKQGVPYEASIDFSGGAPVIEYVPQGASSKVNGQTFAGPGYIIRQWTLRGLAICPYGQDPNTSTAFSNSDKITVTTINAPEEASQMSQANKPAETPAPVTQAVTPPAAATQQAATPPATPAPQDKYITAFGDTGARWFLENKPFEDCATQFVKDLREANTKALTEKQTQFDADKAALQAKVDELSNKLASLDRGAEGATFSNADGKHADPKTAKLSANLGPNLGRMAAAMKLPGATDKK